MAYQSSSAPPVLNLLAAAKRVWSEISPEIKAADSSREGVLIPPEDLKKVCKWMANTVTKFGASAAVVADPEEAKKALTPIAEEVVKSYTALMGTLLSMSSGAGITLARELKESAEGLTEALHGLGMAVCTASLAGCAGKALEHVEALERCSTKNRAALARRFLRSLAQLRDANREMHEELEAPEPGGEVEVSGDEELLADEDDLVMPPMDPAERIILEQVLKVSVVFEDLVKQVSTACIEERLQLEELEAVAELTDSAAGAVDALAADSVGGTDLEACKMSLEKLKKAVPIFNVHFPRAEIQEALDALEASILSQE